MPKYTTYVFTKNTTVRITKIDFSRHYVHCSTKCRFDTKESNRAYVRDNEHRASNEKKTQVKKFRLVTTLYLKVNKRKKKKKEK